jgi:hypothetical protein
MTPSVNCVYFSVNVRPCMCAVVQSVTLCPPRCVQVCVFVCVHRTHARPCDEGTVAVNLNISDSTHQQLDSAYYPPTIHYPPTLYIRQIRSILELNKDYLLYGVTQKRQFRMFLLNKQLLNTMESILNALLVYLYI